MRSNASRLVCKSANVTRFDACTVDGLMSSKSIWSDNSIYNYYNSPKPKHPTEFQITRGEFNLLFTEPN